MCIRDRYKNEKEVAAAELKVQERDFNIFRKSLSEKKRTLDDAQIRSPRKAILTYINNPVSYTHLDVYKRQLFDVPL